MLVLSRKKNESIVIDDTIAIRHMVYISMSWDHRVIDGADGARIMRWIVEAIEHYA